MVRFMLSLEGYWMLCIFCSQSVLPRHQYHIIIQLHRTWLQSLWEEEVKPILAQPTAAFSTGGVVPALVVKAGVSLILPSILLLLWGNSTSLGCQGRSQLYFPLYYIQVHWGSSASLAIQDRGQLYCPLYYILYWRSIASLGSQGRGQLYCPLYYILHWRR